MQVADDAGLYAHALEDVLARIPHRWGRWLDSGAGWYPLIAATDQALAHLDADYVVHQIKEKYGTLRYYCTPSSGDASPQLLDAFDAVVGDAERASAITCEHCGEPGALQEAQCWVKTLCASSADILGYLPRPR